MRDEYGWQLGQSDSLPFGIRGGEAGSPDEVYSIGVKVPELPWLVVQEVPVAAALKPFLAQRNAIVIWAVIAVVVVLLALLAVGAVGFGAAVWLRKKHH